MTGPTSPTPATLSGFRAPVLTDRERWLCNGLRRRMVPRVKVTENGCRVTPGVSWYATYAAISGYCGIPPLSLLELEARDFVRVYADGLSA